MSDRETISRVAKILARAGSDNPNEAAQALQGAYKRMLRDGVTLRALLSLPLEELYQDTLVKLIDVILADQPNLSPSAKREAYSEYMLLIVARFSGAWDGQSAKASSFEAKNGQTRSREEEARRYEDRRRQQEAERGRGGPSPTPPPKQEEKPYSRQNGNTQKWANRIYPFTVGKFAFSFSPATFFLALQVLFGRGSITWHAVSAPGRALRLVAVAMLYGFAFAGVVLTVAGIFHALTNTGPLWDIRLKNAFSFLTAIGFIFKARQLFLAGWFR